jgi:hypothetical protein
METPYNPETVTQISKLIVQIPPASIEAFEGATTFHKFYGNHSPYIQNDIECLF